uniref:Protein myomixer n=1 Tax=Danio rerio TaxID=7955 RepID=MYMX_DANRE|nr:RecName: Full=Protein myomixer [Danio rerio]UDE16204.1 MYMX [Danio rerio]
MPAVFLLLRSLVVRLFGSRLAASGVQLLRRILTTATGHLGTVLRNIWERISSQQSKEAILGCVLCLLNMHKKVDN